MPGCNPLLVLSLLGLVLDLVSAYSPLPRWGQAAALVNDVLFIHGGKTDEYNAYGYHSAQNNNDLLFLSLSSPFDPSDPPWDYVGGSSNSCTTQGPAVAFHSLSAFLTTELLLFGGDPGPNSQSLPESSDSAALAEIMNRLQPSFMCEDASWAGEPLRRIYHRTATVDGVVYIFGGLKVDGASALSDDWLYDPSGPDFHQLPTDNSPGTIYGHASVVLEDGRILIFGGYSGSSLFPLSDIWVLDTTQSTLSWSTLSVDTSVLPNPRRNFAYAYIGSGKILIQGGGDGTLQNLMSDGWMLDVSKSPAVWTQVDALSSVGQRIDHFAAYYGSSVVFGFGFGTSGPAPADLQVYDVGSGSMTSSWQPPATPSYMTTLPYSQTIVTGGTPTGTTTGPYGSTITGVTRTGSGSGTASETATKTTSKKGGHHTATQSGDPSATSGSDGGDGGGGDDSGTSSASHKLALGLGLAFGVLGLLAGLATVGFCLRRRRVRAHRFHLIGGGGGAPRLGGSEDGDLDEESPHADGGAAAVRSLARGGPPTNTLGRVAAALGLSSILGAGIGATQARERRDMLANEDARSFDYYHGTDGWYYDESGARVRRQGSSSTTSSGRRVPSQRPTFGNIMQGSWASLRSVGAMIAGGTAVATSTRRQGSGSSRSVAWREKDPGMLYGGYDPFGDEEALMAASSRRGHAPSLSLSEKMPLPIGAARPQRPRAGRQATQSSTWSYNDPFADPGERDDEEDLTEYLDEPYGALPKEEKPAIRAVMPGGMMPGGVSVDVLSPVSERPSVDTSSGSGAFARSAALSEAHASLSDPSSSTLDFAHRASRESPLLSGLSHESSRSPQVRPTSILDANPSPNAPSARMRRSGSWWSRFAPGSILERRRSGSAASESGSSRPALEFRDPNPPPRLIPIKESSGSQHSPQSSHHRSDSAASSTNEQHQPHHHHGYAYPQHGKSASSLQTAHTADSEAIERMGGTMDVVKRDSSSHVTTPSTASSAESARTPWRRDARPTLALSVVESADGSGSGTERGAPTIDSPAEMTADERSLGGHSGESEASSSSTASGQRPNPPRRASAVAERVRAYERRMSLEQAPTSPPPPEERSTRQREVRSPKRTSRGGGLYGLAPKAPLYVANPSPNHSSDNLTR
ncbi:hypothetical protein PUNSTDRAFT_120264 [Punctularia strigosozonata HHB-11173 SS5]|uniref:uncharacterized protein n=1 Tax=Punctularia strigosozonata (strain HHB-11173) TaxID=741275 RepID=UPI000441699A|nr:uncharacterized protein PUNSTDRAFT_120264 [Punctularia strigosozonata HHB-11173 SS5]EIN10057.1 hypothetical protein PUNSTDRAFT_120264 [Punctularia strigosozonata HHB-11173 SS5]